MDHYLMYPSIRDNKIAFVTEDDLWVYDENLRRLTDGFGVVKYPKISEDGSLIAFALYRNHGDERNAIKSDLYVIPSNGGNIKRLTYLGSRNLKVLGFFNGKIYFSSSHKSPKNAWNEIFYIDPEGGMPEKIPFGPANDIYIENNIIILGRNTADPARWKRYRGGTIGQIWVSKDGGKTFKRILENINGNLASPMLVNGRIFFISDHESIGRIYSCDLDGNDLMVHTNNIDYYARFASTDGKRIVFQMAGDIYIYDGKLKKLSLDIYGSKKQLQERMIENTLNYLDGISLNQNGEEIALCIRGKVARMKNWEGPVFVNDRIRNRLVQFTRDNKNIAVLVENGREKIIIFGENGIEKIIDTDVGPIQHLWVSNSGKIAFISTMRQELYLVDLEKSELKFIDRTKSEEIEYLDISPDDSYIAYVISEEKNKNRLRIRNIKTMEFVDVKKNYRWIFSPSFDPLGRYLYFISLHSSSPIYEIIRYNLSYPLPSKIYLITLNSGIKNPFLYEPDGEQKEIKIEFENIDERIIPVPLPEGRYFRIAGVKNGFLYHNLTLSSQDQSAGEIRHYNINDRKDEVFVEKAEFFVLSGDRTKMLYKNENMLRVVSSTEKSEMKNTNPGKETGIIDISRIKLKINPLQEFSQMLYETWSLMRENYWKDENIKWDDIFKKYYDLLNKISTRSELSDLIWELQGELGTSHSYEYLGDYHYSPRENIGFLGGEIDYNGKYYIKKIYRGRMDDISPLSKSGADAMEGDVILSINGIDLDETNPPGKVLLNMADETVAITLLRKNERITRNVKLLGDESYLIYREWVENNKDFVHRISNNRVGYVHIPDMGNRGYNEFFLNYLEESEHEALIIDVRFNTGGYVSPLLLEVLNRKIIGYDNPRHGMKTEYPPESPKGPVVCLTNELSGSDGDIFSHAFKLMKIGPLIGTRTWGGVIGINPRRRLIDGTVVTQPEYAFWFKDVGFGVENRGTEPDIYVENTPQDYSMGRDVQLEKAVEIALKLLEKS